MYVSQCVIEITFSPTRICYAILWENNDCRKRALLIIIEDYRVLNLLDQVPETLNRGLLANFSGLDIVCNSTTANADIFSVQDKGNIKGSRFKTWQPKRKALNQKLDKAITLQLWREEAAVKD